MDMLTWTFVIFLARVLDVSLGTVRVQFIVRRRKVLAALTGFVEVLIFILIVSRVIQDIHHWPYVLAYAGGFATGTLLGMHLSERLSRQVVQATVISNGRGSEVEMAIREAGFALTRYAGAGRDGPVDVLDVVCTSRGCVPVDPGGHKGRSQSVSVHPRVGRIAGWLCIWCKEQDVSMACSGTWNLSRVWVSRGSL